MVFTMGSFADILIIRETGMFFGWVILLGSFFEKQVIGMETRKEIMIMLIQNGTENDEKVTPGRPKSEPWRGLGSDALSGPLVSVCQIRLFPTLR